VTVEDVLRRARVLAGLRRYDDADPLLARVLGQEPDNEEALALLSRGLVGRGRYGEAEAPVRQLLRAHPDSVRGLVMAARLIASLLGRPRDALPFARRAVEVDPGNAISLVVLAEVLNKLTHGSAEALAVAEQAVCVDPDYALAHKCAGKICLDVGRYAEAERWMLQSLRIEPGDPYTMLLLGLARAGLGRLGESREQVMAALQLKPTPGNIDQVIEHVEYRGIPGHLAEVYRLALAARGRPDLSHPGAAGNDPELIAAQGALARRMYTRRADPAGLRRATELADAVLAADPGNQDARYVRARMLNDTGQFQQARSLAEQLLAEGFSRASSALVPALSGLGDHEEALAVSRSELAANPDDPMSLLNEAESLRELKRYDEALRSARRAAELSPFAPGVQLGLGLATRDAGDLALAERILRAAAAQGPAKGQAAAELAVLLAQAGRWPEAEALMNTLTADGPDADQLAGPCLRLFSECAVRAANLIGDIRPAGPTPEFLGSMGHWLDLMLRMARLAAIGRPADTAKALRKLPALLAALEKVPAPPDSEFARVLREFGALQQSWRPT
jgi:tetratricopeptide (TPR) repeat protein